MTFLSTGILQLHKNISCFVIFDHIVLLIEVSIFWLAKSVNKHEVCGGCYHKLAEGRISLANTPQKGFLPMERMIILSVPIVYKYCNKLTHYVLLISKISPNQDITLNNQGPQNMLTQRELFVLRDELKSVWEMYIINRRSGRTEIHI